MRLAPSKLLSLVKVPENCVLQRIFQNVHTGLTQ